MSKNTAVLEIIAMLKDAMPSYCSQHYLDKYAANNLADFIETLASRLEEMTCK